MANSFDDLMVKFKSKYKKNFVELFSLNITRVTSKNNPLYLAERNQSVNFVKAVQAECLDAVAWYEFPFSDNQHLDAMVYIPSNQDFNHPIVLLIESKNLRTLKIKIPELIRDVIRINRIKDPTDGLRVKLDALFSEATNVEYYGVILCDVQKTYDTHMEIADNWSNGADKLVLSQRFIKSIENQQRPKEETEKTFEAKVSEETEIAAKWLPKSIPLKVEYSDVDLKSSFVAEHYKQLIRYWPIEL